MEKAIINSVMFNKVINVGYQVCVLAAVSWLCWTGANFFWLLVSDVQAESLPPKVSNQPFQTQLQNKSNISLVNQLNLFGKPHVAKNTTSSKKSKLAEISAPETKLNLKLMGLRHGTGSIKSSAIIEGPDKKQNIYYEGDTLPSGKAVVEEIYVQHMIISRQGKYETLTLFTLLKGKKKSKQGSSKDSDIAHTDMTSNTFVTNKFVKYKAMALKNPMALDGMVKVQTVMDGGKMRGYKLSPGYDSRFFGKAGLKRGDILTAVNGVTLDSERKVMSLIGGLSIASDATITIERGGQPMTFRYNLK